ncbi:phage holin family protein [Caballeronia sp. LZ032]|uniref:phage holin family protein n=1 Tax=Caballeronia sp. LZ032 TaxID=3038565 RepID=UPI00285BF5B5|nr:phage holin family protein [Caballeronia sp. LZ032]MDR5883605.1 phage holin family protein [Caballeronia sp. LZ032]
MHISFAVIALAAHVAAMLRVLFYRRNGARHRHHVSWVAWAVVAVSGGSAIELALHAKHVGFFEAATAILLALFVYAARGNIARLLWSSEQ